MELTNQKGNEQVISNDIRISYFTISTNKGIGYICMALNRPPKESNSKHYKAAFSCYSPDENKSFSKTNARNAAIGRLIRWRNERKNVKGEVQSTNPRLEFDYIEKTPGEKFNLKDVFEQGLVLAMNSRAVPGWTAKNSSIVKSRLNSDFDFEKEVDVDFLKKVIDSTLGG